MITLRDVTMEDAEMLLRWKNEEDTRKNAILTDGIIPMESHLRWLKGALVNEDVYFKIIMLDGEPAGDVRISPDGKEREISIRMDKKFRGRGLATQVIGMFRGPLVAKIRAHNIASMRVFIANGFRPDEYTTNPVPYYIFRK